MNRFSLSKGLGAGILILGLATVPLALPASAQNAEPNGPIIDTTPLQESDNDLNPNYGWLGLVGLIGLVKLFRKGRKSGPQPDPQEGNSSGYGDPSSVHPSGYTDSDAVGRSYTDPANLDGGNLSGYGDPSSAHPSSYSDSDAVGRSYTDPDVGDRPKRR